MLGDRDVRGSRKMRVPPEDREVGATWKLSWSEFRRRAEEIVFGLLLVILLVVVVASVYFVASFLVAHFYLLMALFGVGFGVLTLIAMSKWEAVKRKREILRPQREAAQAQRLKNREVSKRIREQARERKRAALMVDLKFVGQNLAGVDWSGRQLRAADFLDANLRGAKLTNADLYGANLNRANLLDADLTGANLKRATYNLAVVTRAQASQVGMDYSKVRSGSKGFMSDLYRRTVDFEGQFLNGYDFSGKEFLREANFREAHLEGANFAGRDLRLANFEDADLTRANLSRANLAYADLSRCSLTGANLEQAILTGARLTGAFCREVFFLCDLRDADFSGADCEAANFRYANMAGAVFRGAKLVRAEGSFKTCADTTGATFH